jgi:tubulin--tyrosine ligase
MQQIVAKTTKALLKQAPYFLAPQKTKVFEIFGYDFMLDDKGKLWLLEINQSPDMPMFEDNPMKAPLWQPFWQNIVDEFVIPIALQQAPQQQYHYYQQCFSASDAFPFWRRVWTKLSCRSFIQ